jgi:uncharacterized protein with von Willebrand factor type A (vWA) domain
VSGGAHGLLRQLARFAAALRAGGVRVGLGDELDAASALALVDLLDRAEVRRALLVALKVPREAYELFDRLFGQFWGGGAHAAGDAPRAPLPRDRRGPPRWRWDGERVRLVARQDEEANLGDTPGFSPEPILRRKPFERCSQAEIAALERMLQALAPRLEARRSRRLVPVRGRGLADLRRSLRLALRTDGELLQLARRARREDEPELVVLCDTSGSMHACTRMLLAFGFALRRTIRRVEIFAFNTELVRVTRAISPAEVERSLGRLGEAVPDWSGGTRIGECLAQFNARFLDKMINRRTTVLILSDGLDHGDAALLGRAMRRLGERAARLAWLNPLAGDARYRPETDCMRAALPFVDHFGAAHNFAALEESLLRLVR